MNILRAGNDPNTGLPAYIVQSAPMVRLVECPKELRKSPLRAAAKDPKSIPGLNASEPPSAPLKFPFGSLAP